ncbi:MAG: CHRD domain-containing protein, partial [Gammaproteobacteria bacterium]|nr:CHRD domain-containing protein [Gammaproteobacteria bacterium]
MDIVPVSTETTATRAMALAAITIDESTHSLSIHVNTVGLEDATAARLHQAPANRNGPELVALTRNADNPAHWSLDDWPLTAGQYLALRNQGLYLTVETAAFPGGQVRGQLIPADSMPGGTESFRVLNVTPAQGAEVASLPASITVTLNRDVLVDSVGPGNVLLTRSGGDGDFGSNDEAVDPMANTVTGNLIELDLTGIVVPDDLFQLSIADITDEDGVLLDGDGDGAPGGLFTHTFSVMASAPAAPTLTELQNTIFTPTCTNIGCHSGPAPAVGLNLTAGQTFANLVGIPSAEQAGLSRVDPGSPDTSYLVHKIEGRASITSSRMPLGGPMLPMQQLQSIRDWISAGAGDN